LKKSANYAESAGKTQAGRLVRLSGRLFGLSIPAAFSEPFAERFCIQWARVEESLRQFAANVAQHLDLRRGLSTFSND
jgi:hypothetical protein